METAKDFKLHKVFQTYKNVRKIHSVTGHRFLYYLIKTYLESGYDEVTPENVFKAGYEEVMEFLALNPNLKRIVEEYRIETDYSVLSQLNKDS